MLMDRPLKIANEVKTISDVPWDGDGMGPRAVGTVQVMRVHQEGHHLEAGIWRMGGRMEVGWSMSLTFRLG